MAGYLIAALVVFAFVMGIRSAIINSRVHYEWASILYPGITNANAARLTDKQLALFTKSQVQQRARILDDCTELIQKTVDPDVFFMRLALALEHTEWIASVVPYANKSGFTINGNPDRLLVQLDGERNTLILEFLDRYWNSVCENSMKFATQKTRIRKVMNALDPLKKHAESIGPIYMDLMRQRIAVYQDVCDHQGSLQKDLVNAYPEGHREKIRSILYFMDKSGCITREKTGSTYLLSIP